MALHEQKPSKTWGTKPVGFPPVPLNLRFKPRHHELASSATVRLPDAWEDSASLHGFRLGLSELGF